jgi:predicted acyl esterase
VGRQRLLHGQRDHGRRLRPAADEGRADVLVYSAEPFAKDTELSGPIAPTLYVSSDARDTDFTVKVLDVAPDGTAWNLDESIQRMRWREGYDKPPSS